MDIIDRTEAASAYSTNARGSSILLPAGHRDLSRINAVVLHQTDYRTDARGNDITAYDRTIAHFVIIPNGMVLQVRPLQALVSGPIPARAVQIETVGDFPSERGRAGSELPRLQQVRACKDLILWLHAVLLPQPLRYVHAHRQFTRPGIGHYNCPGPHLWYNVGRWARAELGLSSYVTGAAGLVIPDAWESDEFSIG